MSSIYKQFKKNVKSITDYYMLLVEETKSQRLVGSTNEWVLDNYFMISERTAGETRTSVLQNQNDLI